MQEPVKALTDEAFAPLGDRPRYTRDGAERLREHLAQFPFWLEVNGKLNTILSLTEQIARPTPEGRSPSGVPAVPRLFPISENRKPSK